MCIRDRRTYRHKAYYSLDRDDGLEHEAVFVALSPHELYERKVTMQELHAAISSLPDKQAKRIYAHFILGMTKQDIALSLIHISIASVILAVLGVALFFTPTPIGGIVFLFLAFLLSPYGLQAAAGSLLWVLDGGKSALYRFLAS